MEGGRKRWNVGGRKVGIEGGKREREKTRARSLATLTKSLRMGGREEGKEGGREKLWVCQHHRDTHHELVGSLQCGTESASRLHVLLKHCGQLLEQICDQLAILIEVHK